MNLHSYASIYNLGHRAVVDILSGQVVVQEKVDGSQFSFGMVPVLDPEGRVDGYKFAARSKGAVIEPDNPPKLFAAAVETAKAAKLTPGWTYRAESMMSTKHNTLTYGRVPQGNAVVFDVDRSQEDYLSPAELGVEATRVGFEATPVLHVGKVESIIQVNEFLTRESGLGGCQIEGVVIKAYGRYGKDKKTLMAKLVSEAFKEVHRGDWKLRNPNRKDVVDGIITNLTTEARWLKAVQHLRDDGQLLETPADIGALIREVASDVLKENEDEIREVLFKHFWKDIQRGVTKGLPEWYKQKLAERAFEPRK